MRAVLFVLSFVFSFSAISSANATSDELSNLISSQDWGKATPMMLLESEAGDLDARFWLSWSFFEGRAVDVDVQLGVDLMRNAAFAGNATAAKYMGNFLAQQNKYGTHNNLAESVLWYERSAAMGDMGAYFLPSIFFRDNEGVYPKNLVESYTWAWVGAATEKSLEETGQDPGRDMRDSVLVLHEYVSEAQIEEAVKKAPGLHDRIQSHLPDMERRKANAEAEANELHAMVRQRLGLPVPKNLTVSTPTEEGDGQSPKERLRALKELEDEGLISADEAARKRQEILDGM